MTLKQVGSYTVPLTYGDWIISRHDMAVIRKEVELLIANVGGKTLTSEGWRLIQADQDHVDRLRRLLGISEAPEAVQAPPEPIHEWLAHTLLPDELDRVYDAIEAVEVNQDKHHEYIRSLQDAVSELRAVHNSLALADAKRMDAIENSINALTVELHRHLGRH